MAIKLNLLPPELAIDKNLSSLLKLSRSLGVISIAAFLIFVLGVGGFFIVSTVTLNNLNTNTDALKKQIADQETSEQQIVLLKDRIKKISLVQSTPGSLNNLVAIDPFLLNLTADSSVSELSVDSQKTQLLLNFKSNSQLSTFLDTLSASDVFKTVVISSFSLSPVSGYSVGVNIENK